MKQQVDRNNRNISSLFHFSYPSSPQLICTAAAAAMRTMEKKGRAYAALSFFKTIDLSNCRQGNRLSGVV